MLKRAVPILPATDLSAALEFYRDKLGFQTAFSHGEPPQYAGVVRDGVEIHLCMMEDGKAIAEQTMLRFGATDLDNLYKQMQQNGVVHPNGALETKPWGTREFTILDWDGVCITFFEETAEDNGR